MKGPENISTEERLNSLYETGLVKPGMPASEYKENARLFLECLYKSYDANDGGSMQLHVGERWFRNHKIKDTEANGAFYRGIGLIQPDLRTRMSAAFDTVKNLLESTDCYTTVNCYGPSDPKADRFGRYRDDRAAASVTAYTGFLIDIDFHDLGSDTMNLAIKKAEEALIRAINDKVIPVPTMMVFSGRGFQLHYLYQNPVASTDMTAVERHRGIYAKLFAGFKELFPWFGIDTCISDGSRICRIAGCWHSKAERYSSLVFYDGPRYTQDDITDLFDLDKIPEIIDIKEARKGREKTAPVKPAKKRTEVEKNAAKVVKIRQLPKSKKILGDIIKGYSYIIKDVVRLAEYRKMEMNGYRELSLHILYNACRCRGDSVQTAYESICKFNACFTEPLNENEIYMAMQVAHYDWYDRGYYDYNRSTVFEVLGMTDEENEALKLVPELLTEQHNKEAAERDKTICELYKEGYTVEDIALMYQGKKGYSKRTIQRTVYERYHLNQEYADNSSYKRYQRVSRQHLTILNARMHASSIKGLSVTSLPDDSDARRGVIPALQFGYNVYINGSGGTGKTYIVDKEWYSKLPDSEKEKTAFLSFTGSAAKNLNVNGMTLHSFLGIRKENGPVIYPGTIYQQGINNILKYNRIVVDEISMARVDLFEALCRLVDYAWNSWHHHYVQLVVLGDWYQLGPYASDEDVRLLKAWYPGYRMGFAYESTYWHKMDFVQFDLFQTKRFVDPVFRQCCTNLEYGLDVWNTVEYLNSLDGKPDMDAVFLCGLNKTVNEINDYFTARFSEEERHAYLAWADGSYRERGTVVLAIGMPVMCVHNDHNRGIVNGSRGIITQCHKDGVVVRFDEQELLVKVTKRGIPIVPAYAITIHKSQGMTFDRMNLVIDKVFEPGQLFVSVSRCRSAEGLHILGRDITVNDVILSPVLTRNVQAIFMQQYAS